MEKFIEPKVIFEDEWLLVVDKPSGMVVNRCETQKENMTLEDWLEAKKIGLDAERNGIVHRLDKETSGLLVVAKTQAVMDQLQAAFKQRQVQKEYFALVHGRVLPGEGEINMPITRNPFNRKRFGVFAGGRESMTHYKTERNFGDDYTLVRVQPKSGRTHQIRVHFKYLNHPLVSDDLYGGRKTARNDRRWCPRLWLQAAGLSLIHPQTQQKMHWQVPVAADLQESLLCLNGAKRN